jgi:hypothetical protein
MATSVVKPVRSELCCMNHEGDKRIMWDSSAHDEIKEAEETFNEYKKKGYLAYRVNKKGDQGSVIDAFDPSAERIIMQPQMIGG